MLRDIYLRPIGLYPADVGERALEVWGGMRLADGWLDFLGLEVIERNGARVDRRVCGLSELFERDWGRRSVGAADLLENVRAPRPRLAGLSLEQPRIVGIVNVTPDSFSDGGHHATTTAAIDHGLRLLEQGADVLDIGGESTRPGSHSVPVDEERRRVLPVIEALAAKSEALISIDTRKASVMREAVAAGAGMINDVSALTYDTDALQSVADLDVPVILMHAQGDPKTMQDAPAYGHVLLDVFDHLEARVEACLEAGIARRHLVVDPGIGFGKTVEHNLELMRGLSLFHGLGVPVMLGASRKRFIGSLTGVAVPADRVHGSVAAALTGVSYGVQLLRVHDVKATREAVDVWLAT
ncbi:MAG: dihydropteroate synthase [Hyphomicrobiaceae bacterium]